MSLNRFTLFGCAERVVGFLTRSEPSGGSRAGDFNELSRDLRVLGAAYDRQKQGPVYDQLIAKKTDSLCS